MSLLIPLQLFLIVFILFAASRAMQRFRGGTLHFGAFLFWIMIWTAAAIAVFFPSEMTTLAKMVGIGRGADVIIYTSIALLFYLTFRLHALMEGLESKLSQLIREISLKEAQEKK